MVKLIVSEQEFLKTGIDVDCRNIKKQEKFGNKIRNRAPGLIKNLVQIHPLIYLHIIFQIMKRETKETVFSNPKWQIKPKLHRYPTKRWGHTAVVYKSKLYIYGGKTGKSREPLYEIDCDTFQSHILEAQGLPDSRESHSCSLVKDKLYVWGGCHQNKTLNDCLTFVVKDRLCFWTQIAQFPMIKERESHAVTVLKDKYIFLYGGCDQDIIYEDFYVFNTELDVWFEIKSIKNKIKKRLSCTMNTIGSKIYLFGGECEDQTYENSLYALHFSSLQFNTPDKVPQLACQLIVPKGKQPIPRSSHASTVYKDRYLMIIGGQGEGVVKGKQTTVLLNDIWAYDTVQNLWIQIDAANKNIFRPRSCFTASVYQNKIFIFGGLVSTQNFRSTDEFLVLSLTDSVDKKIEICNLCKLHFSPVVAQYEKKDIVNIQLDNSFKFKPKSLFKIARYIKNPYDALALIVQGFNLLQYKTVTLDIFEGKILVFQGSGLFLNQQNFSYILNNYQFAEQVNSENPRILSAIQKKIALQKLKIFNANLKNGCSRLGNTFLFINRRSSLLDLLLITPDNIFYCEVDGEDYSVSQKQNKSFEIINSFLVENNINLTLLSDETFTVVIQHLLRTSEEQYEIQQSNIEHLSNYLSTLFLQKPELQFTINHSKIEFLDSEVKNSQQNQEQYENNLFNESLELKQDLKDYCIKLRENQGKICQKSEVLIYREGIRVWKFEDRNYPTIQGYVTIPAKQYELNLMRNRLELHSQQRIKNIITKVCQQFTGFSGKRRPNREQFEALGKAKANGKRQKHD